MNTKEEKRSELEGWSVTLGRGRRIQKECAQASVAFFFSVFGFYLIVPGEKSPETVNPLSKSSLIFSSFFWDLSGASFRRPKRDSKEVSEMKIAKDRKVIPDPIDPGSVFYFPFLFLFERAVSPKVWLVITCADQCLDRRAVRNHRWHPMGFHSRI